jgi:hypothetical protein
MRTELVFLIAVLVVAMGCGTGTNSSGPTAAEAIAQCRDAYSKWAKFIQTPLPHMSVKLSTV